MLPIQVKTQKKKQSTQKMYKLQIRPQWQSQLMYLSIDLRLIRLDESSAIKNRNHDQWSCMRNPICWCYGCTHIFRWSIRDSIAFVCAICKVNKIMAVNCKWKSQQLHNGWFVHLCTKEKKKYKNNIKKNNNSQHTHTHIQRERWLSIVPPFYMWLILIKRVGCTCSKVICRN